MLYPLRPLSLIPKTVPTLTPLHATWAIVHSVDFSSEQNMVLQLEACTVTWPTVAITIDVSRGPTSASLYWPHQQEITVILRLRPRAPPRLVHFFTTMSSLKNA
jgi:hypothetical protein